MNNIAITGNTYPVREALFAMGARWDGARKAWMISADKAEAARALVRGAGPVQRKTARAPRAREPLNSPPPAAHGPLDIAAETAKHGRTPIGTKTVPFRRATHKGGDETGETFWGKSGGQRNRYLVLRATPAYYLSRDQLEDFDLFSLEPGYYADVAAVAVEPTGEEIANDPAVKKAAEKAKARERARIEYAVRRVENHRHATGNLSGMRKLWGESRAAGHEWLWVDEEGTRLIYETSSYDDGPHSWELIDSALAAEAIVLAR